MIKKSRKILTLLLASLLIMSSMCALTVSAATSFSVPSNSTEITSTSNTATYTFTNANETGWYKLSLASQGASTNDTSGTKIFTVTATIGDASWSAGYVINTGKHYPNPGAFYLEKGVGYTLNLSFDFSQATATKETITAITFTKQDDIAISSTEENVLSHNAALNSNYRLSTRADALRGNTVTHDSASTCDILPVANAGKAIYRVNAAAAGMYDIYALEGGRQGYGAKLNLYVDDTNITYSESGAAASVPSSDSGLTTPTYTKLGRAVLTAGSHTIEVEVAGAYLIYFSGIKLVPVNNEVKTVGATGETEFSFYNDMLKGAGITSVNYYAASWTTYPEEGLSFTSGGYVSSGGATHYAAYPINVTKAGLYDISFIGGRYTVGVTVEVDGVDHSFTNYVTTTPQMTNASKTLPSGAAAYTAAFKDYVCSIYLTPGIHQIKYKFGTSGYFFAWTIEAAEPTATLSATEATTFPMMSYWKHATSTGEIIPVSDRTASSSPLTGVWAGKESDGYVVFRTGYKLYYEVVSDKEQKYNLSTIVSGANAAAMTITDCATGEVLYQGTAGGQTAGYYQTEEDAAGEITLKQGKTTLEITSTGGAVFFHALKFTPVIENIISADIDAEINQGEGYETVSVPVKFEGSATFAAIEVWVDYDENVEFTGYTAGSAFTGFTIMTPTAGMKPVKLAYLDTTATGVQVNSGTIATLEFKVPKSTAKDYEFTVYIETAEDAEFNQVSADIKVANGKVSVISTDPIITLTNASGTTVEDVVEGTMNVSVDLNGNDYDFVMFAIYTDDGEYAVLEYCGEATVSGTTATGAIQNIELTSGKNYYAKVFVWDEATCYGFSQTFGK